MNFKVDIPIPVVAEALFDSEVKESQELARKRVERTDRMNEIAAKEMAQINEEAKEEYEYNHPTLKQFVEGLKE